MHPRPTSKLLKSLTLISVALMTVVSLAVPATAQRNRNNMQSDPRSISGDSLPHTELYYNLQRPMAGNQAHTSFPYGKINYKDQGETDGPKPRLTNVGTVWPELTAPFPTIADERTAATFNEIAKVTGVTNPAFGAMPATAMGTAMIQAAATQLAADYEADPQNAIARAKEEQNQANQTSADTNAQMERNQAGSAIDFVASYLYNFTVEANNKWNKVRNELFLPMALLLLLPGVVLAQLKATVSAGTPVIADVTSPFDGILRAIVGIFLIPGTYLFINYGIDVSNSITYTIQSEYKRIFGTDMYKDAMCAHIRAFPYRNQSENKGYVPNRIADMSRPIGRGNTKFAEFEGKNLEVALRDPCAKLNEAPEDRANEMVPHVVNAQRNSYNTVNSALAMTWNILCAFQMAYLYYLWFVGPVIAALWVYPMKELRDAFPSWINGVCTICFWSLFWNTTILLMACCRGVDETGTLIMSALNFLSTACVKFAFDFAGLVKEAGMQAAKMAEKGGGGAAGAGGSKGATGADGKTAPPSYAQPGANNPPVQPPAPVTANNGSGERTVASIMPGQNNFGFTGDTGTPGGDGRTRSLGLNATGNGDFDLKGFEYQPPPGVNGHTLGQHSQSLLGATGFVGNFPPGGGGADTNGDGIPDDGNISTGSVDLGTLTPDGFTAAGGNAATLGLTNAAFSGGGDNVNHHNNAHHNALHLSQNDLQHLFLNSPQAQAARDQLQAQMTMNGGPGGAFLQGSDGNSTWMSAAQFAQMSNGADAAFQAGDTNFNVAELAKSAGLDLPSASFSGLGVSPANATLGSGGAGTGGNGLPPSSDPTLARNSLDPNAVLGANGMPLTGGGQGGNGVVPPDVVAAQRQATLDKIQGEITSSMSTIQAQQTAQYQEQVRSQLAAAGGGDISTLNTGGGFGNGAGFTNTGGAGFTSGGGNGDPGALNQPLVAGADLRNQSFQGLVDQFGTAVPNVTGLSASGISIPTPNIDTSQISLASGSALAANNQGVSPTGLNGPGDPNLPAGPGNGINTGNGVNLGTGNPVETAGSYLSKTVGDQWTGQKGFEGQLLAQSEQMARDQVRADVNSANSLANASMQDTVLRTASSLPTDASGGGYQANSPQTFAQASPGGGNDGGSIFAANNQNGQPQALDPLKKESMDRMAETFQGFVPDVQTGGRASEIASGGLGSNAGTIDTGGTSYANNSALSAAGNMGSMQQPGPEQRLPNNVVASNDQGQTGGGFMASNPNPNLTNGQPQPESAQAYLSKQVQDQWTGDKGFEQKLVASGETMARDQVRSDVNSASSLASGPMQDSVMRTASQVPTGDGGGTTIGGSQPTYVASNDTGGYQVNTPQAAANTGGNFARESAEVPPAQQLASNSPVVREQMDQLAQALDYTPEVKQPTHHSHGAMGGGTEGGVPLQGLQYYAQQSYQQPTQLMPQGQLPTQMQPGAVQPGQPNMPQSVPVPMQLRVGSVANNRADALKSATQNRAKESVTSDKGGNGSKANKLNAALGKAGSPGNAAAGKKVTAAAGAGAKSLKDPMGSVSTGSTLRRLRQKRKWSQEEIDAFKKLAGGTDAHAPDTDWEL